VKPYILLSVPVSEIDRQPRQRPKKDEKKKSKRGLKGRRRPKMTTTIPMGRRGRVIKSSTSPKASTPPRVRRKPVAERGSYLKVSRSKDEFGVGRRGQLWALSREATILVALSQKSRRFRKKGNVWKRRKGDLKR